MAQNTTYDKLVATGLSALMQKGYDGVGIGPVLAEAGVPKGSFYHYFSSKDDFVTAVIGEYERQCRALREPIFADRARPALARLDVYFAVLEEELAGSLPSGGCLYGILTQSLAPRSAGLRRRLAEAFGGWQAALAGVIAEALDAGELPAGVDAEAGAALTVDLYEGAVLRAKAQNNIAPFAEFRARLPHLLAAALPTPGAVCKIPALRE